MNIIVNERDGCCESVHIEYTPIEALIINHMKQMLDVEPIFVDVAENEDKEGKENE